MTLNTFTRQHKQNIIEEKQWSEGKGRAIDIDITMIVHSLVAINKPIAWLLGNINVGDGDGDQSRASNTRPTIDLIFGLEPYGSG